MIKAVFTKSQFKKMPEDFRIGAIISDGMWYNFEKWQKQSKASEKGLKNWIEENLSNGRLIQKDLDGISYRFPRESIIEWYRENNIPLGVQLLDFNIPPRIWDNMTETEGFLSAPLREIGTVTFECSPKVAQKVKKELQGLARVRETEAGAYKAYGLDSAVIKKTIEKVFKNYDPSEILKIYGRSASKKREMVDFSPVFLNGLLDFYKKFGKNFIKKSMETINIFLPEKEDQDTQILLWVITAIEKFNENSVVPFSAYLHSTLKHWPYDLPNHSLGLELSDFQRKRSKAIEKIHQNNPSIGENIPNSILCQEMGIGLDDFVILEEKNKTWIASKNATTLTWGENNDEKSVESNIQSYRVEKNIDLAHNVSHAIVRAAMNTECYEDAFLLISQMDTSDVNLSKVKKLSDTFVQEFGVQLGLG